MQQFLNELKTKIRVDSNISIEKVGDLFESIRNLESAISEYRTAISQDVTPDLATVERLRRKLTLIGAIQSIQNPSYFDEFASTLAEHPYSLPKALFDPQGREMVTIDFPGSRSDQQFHKVRMDLALGMLYPGSFTYRYGQPIKVETGRFSQRFIANLRMHTLSPDPIFKMKRDGRIIDVYKPIRLRTMQVVDRNPFICRNCLSISGLDEGCSHAPRIKQPRKLPSSSAVTANQELERQTEGSVALRAPLSTVITSVSFLERFKVGQAVLGFERSAFRHVTIVDYDPPIGMILETKGVAFAINIPPGVLDHLSNIPILVRDVLAQLLAHKLIDSFSRNGMPSYYLEPILSGVISSLGMGQGSKDVTSVLNTFSSSSWVENAIQATLAEGANYYERFDVQERRLRSLFELLSQQSIELQTIKNEIKNRLLHSLAHNLLIAGCVTAGCLPSDLEYLISDNEIVLFDSVDGGNGSSAMIFDFISSRDSFSLTDVEEPTKERTFRPKYFDEAFAELMLPCQQGVSERIFHRQLPVPTHQEISRRITALERQRQAYSDAYKQISQIGVENCFIASLGFHLPLELGMDVQAAERFKESASVCLHGCPDCLVLGNRCEEGGFMEKFSLSKAALDEYFRYMTKSYVLDYRAEDSVIDSTLNTQGVAILSMQLTRPAEEGSTDKLDARIAEFRGRRLGERFIKFAGFWVDSPITSNDVRYSALLVLV